MVYVQPAHCCPCGAAQPVKPRVSAGAGAVTGRNITSVMPIRIDGSTFYSCTDVASACGVSRQTIWRWRQDGLIPIGRSRPGRSVVFSATELEYIRAHAGQVEGHRSVTPSEIYLDNAASTRPLPIVRDAVLRAMEVDFGNPSSAHGAGRRARQALEDARDQVAALAGADRSHVIFTSGGTEANNLLFRNLASSGVRRVITTAVEHSSILGLLDAVAETGIEVRVLPVDSNGCIRLDELQRVGVDRQTFVSIQWANNETGVLQPVMEIAEIVARCGGRFHTDAAQAVGKFNIDFNAAAIDAMTITAHKIHGPQGTGVLLVKQHARPAPLLLGGSQERGLRVGTENFPGIIGFGVAAEHRLATLRTFVRQTRSLRDIFEANLRDALRDARINGAMADRVCTTGSVTIPGVDGQALIAQLDARGIRISQSSACTNMRPEPSYVLRAMGLDEDAAYSTIRYAMSEDSTFEACTRAAASIAEIAVRLGANPGQNRTMRVDKEVA
jgi:cysteine desulfurase